MADADKNLLFSLHKRRLPIDPSPGGLSASHNSAKRDERNTPESGRSVSLADDIESGYMMAPTLQQHLTRIPKSETDRQAVLQKLLNDRERTFAQTTDEYNKRTRRLNEERRSLISQQKKFISSTLPPSLAMDQVPSGLTHWRQTSSSTPQGSRSFAKVMRQNLISAEARINQLREAHYSAVQKLTKPYNGELGPQSYQPWQMEDYFLIRGLVEEMVDHIINKRIHLYPPVKKDATLKVHRQKLEHSTKKLQVNMAEDRLVQLIMEELLLQETYNLSELTAQELYSLWQMIRSKSDMNFMNITEAIATGQPEGRTPDDPTYDLVTKAFYSLQQYREKFRQGVWAHTQPTNMEGSSSSQEEDSDVLLLEFDHMTPMSLRRTEALDDESYTSQASVQMWAEYVENEGLFWKGMTAQYSLINISKKCKGVTTVRSSPNNKLVAVGTTHGDLLIYNMMMTPWQPLRTMANKNKNKDDPIMDINWSMVGTHLVTINLSGLLQVWRVHGLRVKSTNDNKRLEMSADQRGVWPEQLGQLLLMDGDRGDLNIQRGPLAGAEVHDKKINLLPDLASFCPTFTIMGTQTSLAVALTNGDILRLDLEVTLREHAELLTSADPDQERPITEQNERQGSNINNNANGNKAAPQSSPVNTNNNANESRQGTRPISRPRTHRTMASTLEKVPTIQSTKEDREVIVKDTIGHGIPASLFRQHKSPLIYLGFVDNLGNMISVDEKGYIFVWPFNPESRTTYGWFNPKKKYRISGGKVTYQASENGEQNVIFTNQRKDLTKKEMGVERKRVEGVITDLGLKDPWHEEFTKKDGLITSVYLPKEGVSAESGAMFHVIQRHHQTKYLYTYLMKLYEPYKVKSTKLLGVKQTPNGSELVIVLLFPEYPPKDYLNDPDYRIVPFNILTHEVPSITTLVLDLRTFTFRDYLTNIDLSPEQYNLCYNDTVVSFDISQPLGASGASYMFMNYCGILVGLSLTTGSTVMRMKDPRTREPDYPGLLISGKEIKVANGAELSVISTRGRIFVILYYSGEDRKIQSLLQVIEITDSCTSDIRRNVWNSAVKWLGDKAMHPRDQRLDKTDYRLTSEDHSKSWVVELLLESMDRAIEEVEGWTFSQEEYEAFDESDKEFIYTYVIRKSKGSANYSRDYKDGRGEGSRKQDLTQKGSGRRY